MEENLETKVKQRDRTTVLKERENARSERIIGVIFSGLFFAMGTKYVLQDTYFLGDESNLPSVLSYVLSIFSAFGSYSMHRRVNALNNELLSMEEKRNKKDL